MTKRKKYSKEFKLDAVRLHGINPYDYLVDVLQRINQLPAAEVHRLTPRLWEQHFADTPLRSPLHTLDG